MWVSAGERLTESPPHLLPGAAGVLLVTHRMDGEPKAGVKGDTRGEGVLEGPMG